MATSPLKDFLVTFLMPEKCYDRIFVNFLLDVTCLGIILKRVLGLWIIMDQFFGFFVVRIFQNNILHPSMKIFSLGQLPQLIKILWRGSAEGVSLTASLLQLYAFSCPVVYTVAHNFPLFAYAERFITLTQTAVIILLILHYQGKTLKGLLLLLGYGGLMFLLGSCTSKAVASVLQATSLSGIIASKGVQARTNYCNGNTGQLSTLSLSLSALGSLGLLYMSLQDTGMSLPTLSHALSAILSCFLRAQVHYYSITITNKEKSE